MRHGAADTEDGGGCDEIWVETCEGRMLTGTGDACDSTSCVSCDPVFDTGFMPCDAYGAGT